MAPAERSPCFLPAELDSGEPGQQEEPDGAGLSALALAMSPKEQRERQESHSNRPIEGQVVKVIMSELDPFKQTKSG